MRMTEFCFILLVLGTVIVNVIAQTCDYGYVEYNSTCVACGRGPIQRAKRIIGGKIVVPHSWPAQVLIQQYYDVDFEYEKGKFFKAIHFNKCGGTLINDRTVLTAAHCVQKTFKFQQFNKEWTIPIVPTKEYPTFDSIFTIVAGAHNISFTKSNSPIPSTVKFGIIDQIIPHPSYNPTNKENDIAIIRLRKKGIFSPAIGKSDQIDYACLPKVTKTTVNQIPSANEKCNIVGWGAVKEDGPGTDVLNGVDVDILNMDYCRLTQVTFSKSSQSQICAGDVDGKRDSCTGDSGGGLYWYDKTVKKYVIVGITSYGEGCGRYMKPGVYTRVSYFIDWIKKNM